MPGPRRCASFRAMSDLVIEIPTERRMPELRRALDEALHLHFPGGLLARRWEEDVLHLSGPGAEGTIRLADGVLVGRAALRPPASMMRGLIEQKVSEALRQAAG